MPRNSHSEEERGKFRAIKSHNRERSSEMDILRLFFDCDEFCRQLLPRLTAQQLPDGKLHRHRESSLSTSEVMTIVILFQCSGFRNFKTYYTQRVLIDLRPEFPQAVSYQRFVELKASSVVPLAA